MYYHVTCINVELLGFTCKANAGTTCNVLDFPFDHYRCKTWNVAYRVKTRRRKTASDSKYAISSPSCASRVPAISLLSIGHLDPTLTCTFLFVNPVITEDDSSSIMPSGETETSVVPPMSSKLPTAVSSLVQYCMSQSTLAWPFRQEPRQREETLNITVRTPVDESTAADFCVPAPAAARLDPSRPSSQGSSMSNLSGAQTPPPGYSASAMTLLPPMPLGGGSGRLRKSQEQHDTPDATDMPDQDSTNIQQVWAEQGLAALQISLRQSMIRSGSLSTSPECAASSPARAMYVHALTYLLRGLPSDLTPDERRSLSASLPDVLKHESCSGALPDACLKGQQLPTRDGRPSLLHRAAYIVTLGTIALLTFLEPLLVRLYSFCIVYAQYYDVRQRVCSMCIAAAALILAQCQAVGRKRISLYEQVMDAKASPKGNAIEHNLWLAVCSISGGVHQALEEGQVRST